MPDFRVVAERGRYVLGEEDDGYGIWDLESGDDEPVERFPMTDDGFEEAWARVIALHRADRRLLLRTLRASFIIGLILWVVGIVPVTMAWFVHFWEDIPLIELGFAAEEFGFRVAAASIIALVGIAAWRRWFQDGSLEPANTAARTLRAAGGPGVVLIVALCVWIVSGLITPFQGVPSLEGPVEPSIWMQLALVAQYVAFRVAVLAAVVLVFRWIRAGAAGPSGRESSIRRVERVQRGDEVGENRDE